MNRSDFQKLSILRLKEANLLLERDFPCGAYYLAGYAVECALKACISKNIKRYDFPEKKLADESYTHDIVKLVRVAGLTISLEDEINNNPKFGDAWKTVTDWNEKSRYQNINKPVAEGLIESIVNNTYGVMKWLKKYW